MQGGREMAKSVRRFLSYDTIQRKNQFYLIASQTVRITEQTVKSVKCVSFLSTTFVPNIFRSDKYLAELNASYAQ
jgi:hypothetical protein